jgi:hypothetical protein
VALPVPVWVICVSKLYQKVATLAIDVMSILCFKKLSYSRKKIQSKSIWSILLCFVLLSRVSDPHTYYADPDSAFLTNADPDPNPG